MGRKLFYVLILCLLFSSCSKSSSDQKHVLTVFHAPCFSPIIYEVKDDVKRDLGIVLRTEVSGSQVVCRKITELGRVCDVAMLADSGLFESIAKEYFDGYIDFLGDEIVLGVGGRAPFVDLAEQNWVLLLKEKDTVLGRVDENLGPMGYRTLLVWKLKGVDLEADKKFDHVEHLAANLKTGDVDYGFLYKTTCIKHDIRYIELDDAVNLGNPDYDYSKVSVFFKDAKDRDVVVKGAPIVYGIGIPKNCENKEDAKRFIDYLLAKKDEFEEYGYGQI